MNRRTLIKSLSFAVALITKNAHTKGLVNQMDAKQFLRTAKKTREINIKDLGAHSSTEAGFYKFDNRKIIQTAIDYCSLQHDKDHIRWSVIIPDGVFLVTATAHKEASGNTRGISSLLIKNNIIIKGSGTIKLSDGQYGPGAFFRLLASQKKENNLENVDIINISIDGNAEKQCAGTQASNILLECKNNIRIEAIHSHNCNGNGIQIRGGSDKNSAARNITIYKCKVSACKKIGIQIAQFDGLLIKNNEISNCMDNGIDMYGDMGKHTSPEVNGNNFNVNNNIISGCLNGIFPETVANGVIYENTITKAIDSGIHVNRIHGLPSNIKIINNKIQSSKFGFYLTGDMNDIRIMNNKVSLLTKSFIVLGGGGGNSSNISIRNNLFEFSDMKEKLIILNGNIIRNIDVTDNILYKKDTMIDICDSRLIDNNANSINHSVKINNCTLPKQF